MSEIEKKVSPMGRAGVAASVIQVWSVVCARAHATPSIDAAASTAVGVIDAVRITKAPTAKTPPVSISTHGFTRSHDELHPLAHDDDGDAETRGDQP